jgi:hypothetical protein
MDPIMKKILLSSFCFVCLYGLSACSTADDSAEFYTIDQDVSAVDTSSSGKCAAGDSCNDTALINYTRTEADYRAYGERTKRDHLYTQAAAGNNLTATIPPAIEEDVVTDDVQTYAEAPQAYTSEPESSVDDAFKDTSASNFTPSQANYEAPVQPDDKVKLSSRTYEVVCDEECDDFVMADDERGYNYGPKSDEDENKLTEFTEESFDIADYVKENGDEDINFVEVGDGNTVIAEQVVEETKITDETVLTWEANEGNNLRELLTKWSAMAGWKLLWNTNRNYVLNASVMFKGKFADVSSALIRAFARARPAPIATFYKGNRVIVVETMENENAY